MHKRSLYENETTQYLQTFVRPSWLNPYGVMHGGEIMRLMDETAGMASIQYAQKKCVTGAVHGLRFFLPIEKDDLVKIYATLVHGSHSTYTVAVWVYRIPMLPSQQEEPVLAAHGWFTMVGVDEDGNPQNVAPLHIDDSLGQEQFEIARSIVEFAKTL